MSRLKHHEAPGSSYFVTTKCYQGRTIFQVSENTEVLIKTLLYYRKEGAYLLHEFVIMPDHLQVLVTPSPTTNLEGAIQLIKGGSSHRIHSHRNHKVEIWQKGFHVWTIRNLVDCQAKTEYRPHKGGAQIVFGRHAT